MKSRYRWIVLALYALVAGLSQLLWLNFAPLLTYIEKLYGVTEGTASLLLLVFPLIYVVLSVPAGALTDAKGYRYSVGLGAILMALFSCLRIYVESFWVLLVAQIGIAVAQPYVVNGISKLVLDWFAEEQGALATGLGTMGMFIGMAVGMAATPPMVESLGFRGSMIAFAGVATLCAVSCVLWVHPNPENKKRNSSGKVKVTAGIAKGFWHLVKNKDLLLIFLLSFLGLGFFNGLTTWIEPILAPNGINSAQAGVVGGVLILGGIIGSAVIPAISDRYRRRKPFLIGSVIAALLILYPLCNSSNYYLVLVLSALQGFVFLPAYALLLEMSSELVGERWAGSATSVLMLTGNAGGVIVIVAMEAAKGDASTFQAGVLLLLATLGLSVIIAWMIGETYRKKR